MDAPIVTVLNGPNLNLLGTREPAVYGTATLADVERLCASTCAELGLRLEFAQSNSEGGLVDLVQACRGRSAGLVLNAAGYTHTSVALRDAVVAAELPMVEVHLSNVHAREEFRRHSYLSDIASGVIVGCGVLGYQFALQRIAALVLPARPA
ncbi:type II 3-dehydroquinate dehydratase [Auraticoccus sp. F435]|uniref:3-dehydroquinate dehydratase n=1 Tax=Auraticoccus cholistanensis TaxID=2656650 RepID=A0A6A9UWN2_9ACTN|nr:type II 3-dehydroquinate dehydratase [Auraticoccus cholistanensis]MVA76075.1 type II 3-dehydroquinate dehydratase [Auraticoccus cholistanensis]